ncbi:MAG: threonine synthase [Candidatus Sumerlaeaceae bacterium]|nr:threonine synthase [Candidatus Sumerlaeaceae bacterium]
MSGTKTNETSNIRGLVCVNCGAKYPDGTALTCPRCGIDEGILDVEFDVQAARQTLTRQALALREPAQWRYRELLPVASGAHPTPPQIGWTPILEAPRLAQALGIRRLRLKDDGRSASGSFKDRPSAVAVTRAMAEGYREVACASTGNAASSLAHCAAVAGLRANIFVPARVPQGKLAQLLAYGARVFKVEGTYDEAWRLCMAACERFGWYNRNCAVNPYLVEGKKTGGLEIAEQCADDPPDWISVSVGDGCSIAGVWKGIREMREVGITDWTARMLGVQAHGVAPIAAAFTTGRLDRSKTGGDTYADSINCPVPRNWRKAVNAVRESGGRFVTVTDEEIREAVRQTGRLSGVFAEPAAATAVAGVAAARRAGVIGADSSVVVVISGNGLKDLAGALSAIGEPFTVPPDLDAVARHLGED